jgi:isoamylase
MMNLNKHNILRGSPFPYGASIARNGINFSIFSSKAIDITLVIFDQDGKELLMEFQFKPRINRTGYIWHALITDLEPGFSYGYRITYDNKIRNDKQPRNEQVVFLDPYSFVTVGGSEWGKPLKISRDGNEYTFRLSQLFESKFDWGFDQPLNIPLKDSIIYELHVRGYTKHPSSNVEKSGTFLGLTEKIPYLKDLGITAVELMPITDYDETHLLYKDPETGQPLFNFWGYDPISFFAPKASYAFNNEYGAQVDEFKTMVKAFHEAGIEVILDMVFNHTAEGNEQGPYYHFKGFDNAVYYMLDPKDGSYLNFSGCGNTLNCNHPVVREMIIHSLRYWIIEMHVDGFRFDLASILGRGRNGEVLSNPPLLERIAEDPILAATKLIAEAWDAGGLYQVGDFIYGNRWMEWNGKFRDDVRQFVKGDSGMISKLATRLAGSSDLYQDDGREPYHSVNFITCHDGFTLHDLVTYNDKHNHLNGENNRDGSNINLSWNCGIEGETDNPEILSLRKKQIKNFAAILFLSQGVPMMLGGDEFNRTQKGNNNAYCQDNLISWINWNLLEKNKDIHRYFKLLIEFRKNHPSLRRTKFQVEEINNEPAMSWHGFKLNNPDWSETSKSLAVHYAANPETGDCDIYMLINADDHGHSFALPKLSSGKTWHRVLNTACESPEDMVEPGSEIRIKPQRSYRLAPFSVAVLIGK